MIHISSIGKKIMLYALVGSVIVPYNSQAMNNVNSQLAAPFLGAFAGAFAACFIGHYVWQKNTTQIAYEKKGPESNSNVQKSSDSFESLLKKINQHHDKPKNFFTGYYLGDIGSLKAGESKNLSKENFYIKKQQIIFDHTNKHFIVHPDYEQYIGSADLNVLQQQGKIIHNILPLNSIAERIQTYSGIIDFDPNTNVVTPLKHMFKNIDGSKKCFYVQKAQSLEL